MFSKSTWLHLRIPFSFFLMPVYLFALSASPQPDFTKSILAFISLHLLLYPASNGFNSYFDKDEKSIGGLKTPPPVEKQLYYASLLFDLFALILAYAVSSFFLTSLLLYGLASKAYSHPSVRLKKLPYTGWLVTGFFQGFVIFIATYQGINSVSFVQLFRFEILLPAVLSSALLWGSYPMTQVYQHEEDRKRGDTTLSLILGIKGTFYFTAAVFTLANAGFLYYYFTLYSVTHAVVFQLFLAPVLAYFLLWFLKVRKDESQASFRHTMNLNLISSLCLNALFILFCFF